MTQTIVVGGGNGVVGHNVGVVGTNDRIIYHQGSVVTTAPPPYSGPPPGYYPGPYNQPPGTITVTPALIVSQELGANPLRTTCKYCQADIVTRVDRHPTCKTHCCAVALLLLFCWPCIFVPYCTNECLAVDHYCANCNAYIGSYNK